MKFLKDRSDGVVPPQREHQPGSAVIMISVQCDEMLTSQQSTMLLATYCTAVYMILLCYSWWPLWQTDRQTSSNPMFLSCSTSWSSSGSRSGPTRMSTSNVSPHTSQRPHTHTHSLHQLLSCLEINSLRFLSCLDTYSNIQPLLQCLWVSMLLVQSEWDVT